MSVRKKVKVEEFKEIASSHEHYIWHFLQKKQNESELGLFSYFDNPKEEYSINRIKYLLDGIEIPYFESYTEESMDFLMDFQISSSFLFVPHQKNVIKQQHQKYIPLFLGFNKFKLIGGSHQVCYCPDYLVELIHKLNPDYILNSKLD